MQPEEVSKKIKEEERLQQIKEFVTRYRTSQMTYQEMVNIYYRNILNPHFMRTNFASMLLIFMPGLTNLYYMVRPEGTFKKVMMISMPLSCLLNLAVTMKSDLDEFAKIDDNMDSKKLRDKFKFLYGNKAEGIAYEKVLLDIKQQEQKTKSKLDAEKQQQTK